MSNTVVIVVYPSVPGVQLLTYVIVAPDIKKDVHSPGYGWDISDERP